MQKNITNIWKFSDVGCKLAEYRVSVDFNLYMLVEYY